jgi:hypothetical protein
MEQQLFVFVFLRSPGWPLAHDPSAQSPESWDLQAVEAEFLVMLRFQNKPDIADHFEKITQLTILCQENN